MIAIFMLQRLSDPLTEGHRLRAYCRAGHRSSGGYGVISHRESGIVVGAARSERAAAIDLVRQWFDAVNLGEASVAVGLMASPVAICISGGHRFTRLEDFMVFASKRYADVQKHIDAFEACEAAGGVAIYARGRMSGSWQDGRTFENVRWCDRFLVEQGLITDLQTWSDLAETRLPTSLD